MSKNTPDYNIPLRSNKFICTPLKIFLHDHQSKTKESKFICLTFFTLSLVFVSYLYTAISRKVVGKNVHATIPKGNMGYVQYTVPDTVAVEPTFVASL